MRSISPPRPAIGTQRSRGRLSSRAPPSLLAPQDHDGVAAPADDLAAVADDARRWGRSGSTFSRGVGADEQEVLRRGVVARLLAAPRATSGTRLDVVGAVAGRHEHAGAADGADEDGEPERRSPQADGATCSETRRGQA